MATKQESFVSYYNQFKDKIYAYFLYRVGFDIKLAEDLTSEAFLKALKKFDDFDSEKPFQPWIFAISHNHLVNHYKSAKREIPLDEIAGFVKCAGVKFEAKFELERVMGIINQMEEGDREILLLRFAQGLNNMEIAEILDKEEGAVRTQISRSLVKLREVLNQSHL